MGTSHSTEGSPLLAYMLGHLNVICHLDIFRGSSQDDPVKPGLTEGADVPV